MTLELVVNENLTLDHSSGSLIDGGSFTVTSLPSEKNFAGDKKIYGSPLVFTFAGGNATGFLDGSVLTVAAVSMIATAIKVTVDNKKVIREGDSVTMACIGTIDPPPPSAPFTGPVSGDVEITDAGQEKAFAQ
jgi:hypothetical protein